LISLSAGALVGTAGINLIPESIEQAGWLGFLMFVIGYLAFSILGGRLQHICPACSASHTEKFVGMLAMVPLMSALTLHNLMDGMALSMGPSSGAFLAVLIHKLPEGLALAMILSSGLRSLNLNNATILIMVFGIEFNTFLGTLLGANFIGFGEQTPGMILGLVSGGFMFLGLHAFKVEIKQGCRNLVVLCFLLGIIISAFGRHCH
jgi:zinc transporter ZupT